MARPLVSCALTLLALALTSAAQMDTGDGEGHNKHPLSPVLQRQIFLSGKVITDDGSPLPDRAEVETVCNGLKRARGLTDRLSRDQEDVARLFKELSFAGIKLVTLAEGEINELHVGLKGTMNALVVKDTGAKTRRGQEGRDPHAGFRTATDPHLAGTACRRPCGAGSAEKLGRETR